MFDKMSDTIDGAFQMSTIESAVHTFFHSEVSGTRVDSYIYDNLLTCVLYIASLDKLSPPLRNI
jgi:hypothetical protein